MGKLTVNGLNSIVDNFAGLAKLPDSVIIDILNAQADVIVQAQRTEIESRRKGPHSLGISAKFVKRAKSKKAKTGGTSPYTRRRGGRSTRNAEIAFINEYGASGRHIAARPATNTANVKKENEAIDAGEKVYRDYLDSQNK